MPSACPYVVTIRSKRSVQPHTYLRSFFYIRNSSTSTTNPSMGTYLSISTTTKPSIQDYCSPQTSLLTHPPPSKLLVIPLTLGYLTIHLSWATHPPIHAILPPIYSSQTPLISKALVPLASTSSHATQSTPTTSHKQPPILPLPLLASPYHSLPIPASPCPFQPLPAPSCLSMPVYDDHFSKPISLSRRNMLQNKKTSPSRLAAHQTVHLSNRKLTDLD